MKVTHRFEFDLPVSRIMSFYLSDDFYIEKLKNSGAISVEIVEKDEISKQKIKRKAKVSEPSRLPSFLRKKDVDTFFDVHTVDTDSGTMVYEIIPDMMADRFKLTGQIEFQKTGENSSALVFTTNMEVKIPFVGKKAEKHGLKKTEEELTRQVAFINKWAQEH